MINRIDKTIHALQANNKKMLSPYVTAGDPSLEATVPLMHALVQSGADILEIGMPFSDPMAEGTVIQAAMARALANGTNCDHVFSLIKLFRETNQFTPIVLMGYLNPIEYYGYEKFAKKAAEVGVDGTIIVDLPPEESEAIHTIWAHYNLYSIYLCSPTTSAARMELINHYAKGYLYYVSLKGVTGSGHMNLAEVQEQVLLRKKQTALPVMVGFGIKSPKMAAEVAQFADGVIVGAALITKIENACKENKSIVAEAGAFIQALRQAMD